MATDPRRELLRINARRRRLTPRIVSVTHDSDVSCAVKFADPMDERYSGMILRIFVDGVGIIEFTEFEWEDGELVSITGSNEGVYEGDTYAVYMDGDIKGRGGFNLRLRTRCDRVEVA